MTIATAPALLIGLGARILLDHFSRSEAPVVKDFILVGAWQGVALHYATKASKTSGFGIIVAFGIAAKLFIEFNVVSDVTRCVTTILGVALGVLFTDFLSQYFDKSQSSDRRRKKAQVTTPPAKSERKRERLVQFRPSVQGGSVEDIADPTPSSYLISDITSVDSQSDGLGPSSSMSSLDREIHVLRTRASLADSERRRFREERKWAISQGNVARASQMKWEVKRYTALMQTFNREADLKAVESAKNARRQNFIDDDKLTASSAKDKSSRSYRDTSQNGQSANVRSSHKSGHKRPPNTKQSITRDANG
ncbi:hypothetical protein B0H34DRAFT_795671 [Crassisporium funariophilum]|nr:hypothetical protein B0H34DRAFT_795671 [Crassisporium funariophilum]